VRVVNLCEGTDETTVSTGNSGGSGGTAWTSVTIGTDVSVVYDTAQAVHGTTSIRHTTGATSAQGILFWDTTVLGTPARLFSRFYLRLSATGTARALCRVRAAGTQVLRIHYDGSVVELRRSNNNTVTAGAVTLSANAWYRVEVDCRPGVAQTNTVRLYQGDSTALLEEIGGSGDFSAAATVDEVAFGNAAAAANLPDAWYGGIEANDVGWPGPVRRLSALLGAG
jgi:hypothetical protein